ncbi:MAG: ABC-F family ATP-binding cassette domain-containing protein [Clostridium sp.]|nr:ABC-F family ATP-binding cassette domain-containing protein [Clostridium sp.]
MIVLSCKGISKYYGIDSILKNVTFNVNEGEKIGLIGPNGAGKSTLFKILTNQLDYDDGELFIDKSKNLGYLSQNLSLNLENTIYNEALTVFQEIIDMEERLKKLADKMNEPYDISKEDYHNKIIRDYTTLTEVYENRGGYTYKGEISRVLKGLGFNENDFDKSISILSGGQKTRVALCKLLLRKPEVLLLDEPTNHLDLDAIEWLEGYLKEVKGTIVLISHDRFFLDAITDKTIELVDGTAYVYPGNYTSFIGLKEKNMEVMQKAYDLQQIEIKRQEEIIAKYKSFNREKSIRAAESRQKALDKIERIDAPPKESKASRIKFETKIKSGNDVLYVEDLKKSFGDKLLFESLNLDIKREEKIALIGENGRGKTTLFRIIMDQISPDTGVKVLGKNVFVGYYDQEQSNLDSNKAIIDEVWDDFPEMTTTEIRCALAAFLFTGDDVFKKISTLSGGEKCRINLLKLMLSKSNFLLLDEPTNHLDIVSREALEEAILGYDGTILLISHDRYFLNKIINKIYELNEDGIKEYLGNYSYYIEKKKNPHRFELMEESSGVTKTQIKLDKKKKKEAEKAEKEKLKTIKSIEEKISSLEELIEDFQGKLCLEEVYSNPEKSKEIHNSIKTAEDELENLYIKWEELSQ